MTEVREPPRVLAEPETGRSGEIPAVVRDFFAVRNPATARDLVRTVDGLRADVTRARKTLARARKVPDLKLKVFEDVLARAQACDAELLDKLRAMGLTLDDVRETARRET